MEKPARGSTGVLIDSSRDAVAPKPCSPRRSTGPEMRRANSRQAELLELKLELEPPPQLVKPSALRLSPAPAASRADLARNWRRVRETSLIGNSPHPFDPQHHPSPAQRNSFCGGGVSLRRRLSTEPLTTNCSENTIVLQQFEFWQEEREGDFSLARSKELPAFERLSRRAFIQALLPVCACYGNAHRARRHLLRAVLGHRIASGRRSADRTRCYAIENLRRIFARITMD